MSTRKSKNRVALERALKNDKMVQNTINHIILAELWEYEYCMKIHDKSLDFITTYALKAEALLKRAVSDGITKADLDALLDEKPDIEVRIINDVRFISESEINTYKQFSKNILKKT